MKNLKVKIYDYNFVTGSSTSESTTNDLIYGGWEIDDDVIEKLILGEKIILYSPNRSRRIEIKILDLKEKLQNIEQKSKIYKEKINILKGILGENVVEKKIISKKDIIEYANIIKESRINGDRKPIQCWQSLQRALLQYDNVSINDEVDDEGLAELRIRYKNGTRVQLDDIVPSDFYYSKDKVFLK